MRVIFLSFFLVVIGMTELKAQQLKVELVRSKTSNKDWRLMVKLLNYQRKFYEEIYDRPFERGVNLMLFGRFRDFVRHTRRCCDFTPINDAYYNLNEDVVVVYKNQEFLLSFAHESSHSLSVGTRIKEHIWLDEGLADMLSSFQYNEKGELKERLLYFSDKIPALGKGRRYLTDFIKGANETWNQLSINDSYAFSWAIVNFIHRVEEGLLKRFLLDIEKGIDPITSLDEQYKGGYRKFARDLRAFYRY